MNMDFVFITSLNFIFYKKLLLFFSVIAQFKPPIPVTAISWNFNLGVLAAGNEFGYAVCSIRERKLLLIKTLMSSQGFSNRSF